MRFRLNQRTISKFFFLHLILLHDINDIIVFSYEFHSFLFIFLLQTFMKESSGFLCKMFLFWKLKK